MDYCKINPKDMSLEDALKLPMNQKQFYFQNAVVNHPMVEETLSQMIALTSVFVQEVDVSSYELR